MNHNIQVFMDYIESYDRTNYDINYKYFHSFRVMSISHAIAKKLNWSKHDIYLMTVIGLIHDIGRFEQLKKYHTYDCKSMDHGDYGVKILSNDKLIFKFDISPSDNNIILFAVKNHNKLQIEKNDDLRFIMFAELIRDVDKIDIFNAYTDLNFYQITNQLDEVSKIVEIQFFSEKLVDAKNVKTNADILLLNLSYIFDFNYIESIRWIQKKKYLEKIYNKIDNKERYLKYFDFIHNYLERRF